ncbi:MAG: hypothetical protein WC788_00570 [Candidatus Paceibacterota bacterium]|jgi:hypothetical protein
MIKILYSSEKTNSFRPMPWNWSVEPFPAFRGAGARYSAFQPVASGYVPKFKGKEPSADGYSCPNVSVDDQPSKLIETQKGTLLIVPCSEKQDEKLMLITLRGGFRGNYSRVEAIGAEILSKKDGNIHCCPTGHLVVRLTDPKGYVFAETGRRCGTGLVEIFSWDGYKTMPTEEFEVWRETSEEIPSRG